MSTKLKLKVGKTPSPDAVLSAREITPSPGMLKRIFGTTSPRHKMAILLPGSDTTEVDIQLIDTTRKADDDLMALARAVGVTQAGDPV